MTAKVFTSGFKSYESVSFANKQSELLFGALEECQSSRNNKYFVSKDDIVVKMNNILFTVHYLASKVRASMILVDGDAVLLSAYAFPIHWNRRINNGYIYFSPNATAHDCLPYCKTDEPKLEDYTVTVVVKGKEEVIKPKLLRPEAVQGFFEGFNSAQGEGFKFASPTPFVKRDVNVFEFRYLLNQNESSVNQFCEFNSAGGQSELDAWFAEVPSLACENITPSIRQWGDLSLGLWLMNGGNTSSNPTESKVI